MPCSCVEGCTCSNAQLCSGSSCLGSDVAGDNIAAMGSMVSGYHRMWYPHATSPGEPSHEEEQEIREMMRDRNEALLLKAQEKLKEVETLAPGGVLHREHHLEHERAKLTERIRRLEHEVSILSSA